MKEELHHVKNTDKSPRHVWRKDTGQNLLIPPGGTIALPELPDPSLTFLVEEAPKSKKKEKVEV